MPHSGPPTRADRNTLQALQVIPGVGPKLARMLLDLGYDRPHSALGHMTPEEFARSLRTTENDRNPKFQLV